MAVDIAAPLSFLFVIDLHPTITSLSDLVYPQCEHAIA